MYITILVPSKGEHLIMAVFSINYELVSSFYVGILYDSVFF